MEVSRWRGEGKIDKQNGGVGQFARVVLDIEVAAPNSGVHIVNALVGGRIPRPFVPAVEAGVKDALQQGLLAGYPFTDVMVTIVDGQAHAVDSTEIAFRQASVLAFRDAARKAPLVILVALLDITCPAEYLGAVLSDVARRRGSVQGQEFQGQDVAVSAQIPLAETIGGYATTLRSLTQGRASYTLTPCGYEEAPAHLQSLLVAQAAV